MSRSTSSKTKLASRLLIYFASGLLLLIGLMGFIIERSMTEDEAETMRQVIVLTTLAIGLLGVAFAALLARRMARPMTELTQQARALLEGDSGVEPPRSSVKELDDLGLAISALAHRLGTRVADAEEAIDTLEVVLGALPQGTILIDNDDRVVYANPAAHSILGAVPSQLGGLSPLQFQNAVREARGRREPEVRVLDHGSPTRRLRGVATPFAGDERVLLLVVDITERERADSIRRDFVANASHELKTPLSTIIASAQTLQIALDRGDGSAAGFARRIEGSARQLDRLVGDLLDLSRLERESPDLSPVRLDLLIRDEVERVRQVAAERDLDVEVMVDEVTVMASHRDVAVAVRNLLDNAIRYTLAGGSIAVAVGAAGDEVSISVADTGEGIPTRDLDRVFERFYRVDSARSRDTGGTGLGLSIVKHVAESHGGTVSVDSELGVGSTFTIRLPIGPQGSGSESN